MRCKTILTGLVAVFLLTGCGRVLLYGGLSENQANEVTAALLAVGIDAEKGRSDDKKGWKVSVAKTSMAEAMRVLKAEGLPSEQFDSLGDVFKKKGFVSSPLEEKARYLHGLSQELAHTISVLEGVRHARVHIAMPDRDILSEDAKPSSASVVIVASRDSDVARRETDIKAIVKDSIEGLDDVNKVTVKFFNVAEVEPVELQEEPLVTAQLGAIAGPGLVGLLLAMAASGWVAALWRARRGAVAIDAGDATSGQ